MAKIMKDGKPSTSFSRQDREWVKSMRGGDTPTGTITITENGEYDVTNYATADVQVEGGSSDFSTAEVQVTLGAGVTGVFFTGAMTRTIEGQTSAVATNVLDSSGSVSVILCGENGTVLSVETEPSTVTVATTGDINNYYSEDSEIEVLGSGTITITAGS